MHTKNSVLSNASINLKCTLKTIIVFCAYLRFPFNNLRLSSSTSMVYLSSVMTNDCFASLKLITVIM
jgi:hypothetical protein